MKHGYIVLLLFLFFNLVNTSEIDTYKDDDDDGDIVDVSNLIVHIGGGIIFFIGLVFLIELISVYGRTDTTSLSSEPISTVIDPTMRQQIVNRDWSKLRLKIHNT